MSAIRQQCMQEYIDKRFSIYAGATDPLYAVLLSDLRLEDKEKYMGLEVEDKKCSVVIKDLRLEDKEKYMELEFEDKKCSVVRGRPHII